MHVYLFSPLGTLRIRDLLIQRFLRLMPGSTCECHDGFAFKNSTFLRLVTLPENPKFDSKSSLVYNSGPRRFLCIGSWFSEDDALKSETYCITCVYSLSHQGNFI